MTTLKDRFSTLATLRPDISQADVARAAGVKPPSVNGWFSGASRSMKAAPATAVAALYGVDAHWLATGEGAMLPTAAAQVVRVSGPSADRVEAMASMGAVPLISWVQAGCWSDVADPFLPGDADEWLPCPVAHGPRCYAVRVRGDSMNNPGARPSYSDGDIIFVDPDRRANHGDRVIVRLDDHAEATFKQLLVEDGRKLLKALNPEWAPRYIQINGHATIVGVVIGKWVPE
jgi:SOS-response transcriptional repressor LexA